MAKIQLDRLVDLLKASNLIRPKARPDIQRMPWSGFEVVIGHHYVFIIALRPKTRPSKWRISGLGFWGLAILSYSAASISLSTNYVEGKGGWRRGGELGGGKEWEGMGE